MKSGVAGVLSAMLVVVLVCSSPVALAGKRLGGSGSVGKQSTNVTQRKAADAPATAPQAPAATPAPAQQAASPAKAAAPAAQPTPQPAPKKPWGAMLGGLAAGLGLAWLASSLGFGDGLAQIFTVALLGMLVLAAVGWFWRNRQVRSASGDLAWQGAGHVHRDYKPQNVGNDASARPWERNTMAFENSRSPEGRARMGSGSLIGANLVGGHGGWGIPAGFDVDGFLRASKANFVSLQASWDRADIPRLKAMMTDTMLAQIQAQLAERERQAPGVANVTDVVMLEANLLGIEESDTEYMASVEFSGLIREEPSAGPSPFREVWNITRPKAGGDGWLVAGVQALQ